ncbi:MmcB family DNA repair protein [Henriciella aquimarina]|uniref:MmcB family DNA repair protein n=1 Tax=Henriciella aquimarina TaxID=545261 RepID=UPI000A027505|nr:MmcB family DNA repair protein [Henriciella aquimarina]
MADDHLNPCAGDICRGVLRLFADMNFAGVTEMTLANGRRADIAAIGPKGEVTIVEVKSSVADFRADGKWPDYRPFCDRFYFAVSHGFPHELIPQETGLIVADGFGGAVLREPDVTPLAAARRKAVTLRFARLAASRFVQLAAQPQTPEAVR